MTISGLVAANICCTKNKPMKKQLLFLSIFLLFLFPSRSQPVQNGCDKQVKTKVILIGDSWASFSWTYRAYRESMRKYGHADKLDDGLRTTAIGGQGETFTAPIIVSKMQNRLRAEKDAQAVVIYLGGNDFMWAWDVGDPWEELAARWDYVTKRYDTLITSIRKVRPDIKIIFSSYDYTNFVDPLINFSWNPYKDTWEGLGYPTPLQINEALNFIEVRRARWCDSIGVNYLNNMGLMQYTYGQKDPLPVWPYTPYPPRSVPFPGGDPRYPSPKEAMGLLGIDTYHLGAEGFTEIANNCMRQFLLPLFRNDPTATFQSDMQFDGWVTDGGVTGAGELRVGVTKEGKGVKGLLTFNTSAIPDNAVITDASVFVTRKIVVGGNPIQSAIFPGNGHVDIIAGSFGAPSLEASDFNARADMEDAGCFVGQAYKNNYAFRVDVKTEALEHINKNGTTQFRVYFDKKNPDKNEMGVYYNGSETEPYYAPYMDVYYTVDGGEEVERLTLKQENGINLYPNPARDYLVIEGISPAEAASLTVYNSTGKPIQLALLQSGEGNYRLDTRALTSGSYFIQIPGKEGKHNFLKL